MKHILLTALLTIPFTFLSGQVTEYRFVSNTGVLGAVKADAGNTLGGNNSGAGVSGSFFVDETLKRITINLKNLSGTTTNGVSYTNAEITLFGFHDTFDNEDGDLSTVNPWSLVAGSTTGWTATGEENDLWKTNQGEMFTGAHSDSNTDRLQSNESGTWLYDYAGTGTFANLMNDWDSNSDDFRIRFQSIASEVRTNISRATSDKITLDLVPVPEPSTYGLIGAGALVLLVGLRRFQKQKA